MKRFQQTDLSETDAPVGKLTTFRYIISLIGKYGNNWNMDHIDVATTFLNCAIDDDDIFMTPPKE